VLKISILPPNSRTWGFSAPNFAFLDENYPTRQFSDSPQFKEGAIAFPSPLLPRRHWLASKKRFYEVREAVVGSAHSGWATVATATRQDL